MSTQYNLSDYPLQEETGIIIQTAIAIHRILGSGFLEIVYKDALEYEFNLKKIFYKREMHYDVKYKDVTLPHSFYADFVLLDKVIVEVKAKEGGIAEIDYAQTINYLKCSGCKVGLILNFGRLKLEVKRVVY